ncbi:MAG TPA: hypothetical protein VNL77_10780 [Roseiflexaceae bacterium]|nr:hypothetical protein [Roseiflexaceae bacterium]
MPDLHYTLLADGSSDRALMPVLTWALRAQGVTRPIQPAWADLARLRQRPRTLPERIVESLRLYPCDLLFVHRDAEREPHHTRRAEILRALDGVRQRRIALPAAVCVVPVRMQEAWLLFDEAAIRAAAGNPYGRKELHLPRLADLEGLPDPKATLQQLIRAASGLHGRRLQQLTISTYRLAELIDDFAPLRALPAFQSLEAELGEVVAAWGWQG